MSTYAGNASKYLRESTQVTFGQTTQTRSCRNPRERFRHFPSCCARLVRSCFSAPTRPQIEGWPAIARGESTLILAPRAPARRWPHFCGASIASCSARCRRTRSDAASCTFRRSRLWPWTSNAICARRWWALRKPRSGSALRFTNRRSRFAPATLRRRSARDSRGIPPTF